MALQTSGAISFANIQSEFGGVNPISLSEYYGKSSLPGSGTISVNQFYGLSAIYFQHQGNASYRPTSEYAQERRMLGNEDYSGALEPTRHFGTPSTFALNGRTTAFDQVTDSTSNFQVTLADVQGGSVGTSIGQYTGYPANSGWNSITISLVSNPSTSKTFLRSAATFYGNGHSLTNGTYQSGGVWTWSDTSSILPTSNNTTAFKIVIS